MCWRGRVGGVTGGEEDSPKVEGGGQNVYQNEKKIHLNLLSL